MKRLLAAASLALLFNVAAVGGQPQNALSAQARRALTVQLVLQAERVSASIQYRGDCGPGILMPNFPRIFEPLKPYPANAVEAVRAMFSVDDRFAVSQGSNGIIRVVEPGVRTDILGVKISHLWFDDISYPEEALDFILYAPEVQSFMHAQGIGQLTDMFAFTGIAPPPAYRVPGTKHAPPNPGMPSISGELNNVTVADALDYVVKSFPGFWLYQDCETPDQQRVVYFMLFPVPGRMWSWNSATTSVIWQ
jgi:hypothetical protein